MNTLIYKNHSNVDNFLLDFIKKSNINIDDIGGFQFSNKFFYNPFNLPSDNYDFLNIFQCDTATTKGREKNFVVPKNVKTFSVHMITNGLPIRKINSNIAYFNHYCFLNKTNRGFNKTNLTDNTISRLTNLFHIFSTPDKNNI